MFETFPSFLCLCYFNVFEAQASTQHLVTCSASPSVILKKKGPVFMTKMLRNATVVIQELGKAILPSNTSHQYNLPAVFQELKYSKEYWSLETTLSGHQWTNNQWTLTKKTEFRNIAYLRDIAHREAKARNWVPEIREK